MIEHSLGDQRRARLRRSPWRAAWALALTAACAAPSGGGADFGPAWGGDPAAIAVAGPLLATQADALAGVRIIEAVCQRTERAIDGATRAVDNGRLVARRAAPCVVLTVTTPRPRTVREDATTRLVLEPLARGATRWTFKSNARGLLAVAAVFLDLEGLARAFDVTAVTQGHAEDAEATCVVLTPRPGTELEVQRLELVLIPGQAVPRLVTVVGRGGDQLVYRIQRPSLDPPRRDPDARFRVEVPAGYALQELTGQ